MLIFIRGFNMLVRNNHVHVYAAMIERLCSPSVSPRARNPALLAAQPMTIAHYALIEA